MKDRDTPIDKLFARIPQPERSGTVGSILAVMFLFTMISGFDAGAEDFFCGVLPWNCHAVKAAEDEPPRWRDMHIQLIGLGKGHGRVCEVEETLITATRIGHQIGLASYLEYCDTDDVGHTSSWIFPVGYNMCLPVPSVNGPFLHCDPVFEYRSRLFWSDKVIESGMVVTKRKDAQK